VRVIIRQKNIVITEPLRRYIEMKLVQPIRKLLRRETAGVLPLLEIECARSGRHHRKGKVYHFEANLSLDGKLLRAEVDEEDARVACDLLEEELEREILAYKSRLRALEKRGARRLKKDMRLDPAARFYRKGRMREEGD